MFFLVADLSMNTKKLLQAANDALISLRVEGILYINYSYDFNN